MKSRRAKKREKVVKPHSAHQHKHAPLASPSINREIKLQRTHHVGSGFQEIGALGKRFENQTEFEILEISSPP